MLTILWTWWTATATRTWVAHGLVSLLVSTPIAATEQYFFGHGLITFPVVATIVMFYFITREMSDEVIHRKEGEWKVHQFRDRVTFAVDQIGDLLGPIFVCATAWVVYMLSRIG